jgi:predicted RND superfamily exporter protein
MNLETDFSESDFLPKDTQSYQILTYISSNFNASGMEESYILIKGDITSPELLTAVDRTIRNMGDDSYLSTVNSQNIVYLIRSTASRNSTFSELVGSLDTDGDGLPDSGVKEVYDYLYEHEESTKFVLYRDNGGVYRSSLMRFKPTSQSNSEHAILYDELKQDIAPL